MDTSWLEVAGSLSLSCYLIGMGGLLTLTVCRAVLGNSRPRSASWSRRARATTLEAGVSRFFYEYLGNLGSPERGRSWGTEERRRNPQARMLLDWLKDQMEERGFPAAAEEEFLEHLREAIRHENPTASGAGSSGGFPTGVAVRADED